MLCHNSQSSELKSGFIYIYLCAGFDHSCFRGWCNALTNSDFLINITSYVYSNRVILCHKMLLLWFPSSKVSFKLPFNIILILLKSWNMLIIWVTNDIYFMYFNWYTVTLWHFKITFFTTSLGTIKIVFFYGNLHKKIINRKTLLGLYIYIYIYIYYKS